MSGAAAPWPAGRLGSRLLSGGSAESARPGPAGRGRRGLEEPARSFHTARIGFTAFRPARAQEQRSTGMHMRMRPRRRQREWEWAACMSRGGPWLSHCTHMRIGSGVAASNSVGVTLSGRGSRSAPIRFGSQRSAAHETQQQQQQEHEQARATHSPACASAATCVRRVAGCRRRRAKLKRIRSPDLERPIG